MDMMEEGGPVYQEYGEYEEYTDEELAEPDFYVDQFYPGMEMDEEMMEGGGGLAPFSVSEILEHCIEPTLTDGMKHMGKIIAWCLIFRLATQTTRVVPWLGHAASVVAGTVLASHFFGAGVFYLLGLVMLGYIMLAVSNRVRGLASAALVLGYNIVCETWVAEPVVWHMVRGAIMIVAMKIISLGFDMDAAADKRDKEDLEKEPEEENITPDIDAKRKNAKIINAKNRGKKNGKKTMEEPAVVKPEEIKTLGPDLTKMPGWFEFAGYCLCPGTVILGPWVSFTEYVNIFKEPRWNITWLVKILFTVMFAFMFLTIRYVNIHEHIIEYILSFQHVLEPMVDPRLRLEVVVSLQGRHVIQGQPLLCFLHVRGQCHCCWFWCSRGGGSTAVAFYSHSTT